MAYNVKTANIYDNLPDEDAENVQNVEVPAKQAAAKAKEADKISEKAQSSYSAVRSRSLKIDTCTLRSLDIVLYWAYLESEDQLACIPMRIEQNRQIMP